MINGRTSLMRAFVAVRILLCIFYFQLGFKDVSVVLSTKQSEHVQCNSLQLDTRLRSQHFLAILHS